MKSYLKFLSRNKLYTTIEAVGLTVSLAFVIIIGIYTAQQIAVSRQNPDRERIYTFGRPGSYGLTYGFTDVLKQRVPEVEQVGAYITESEASVDFPDDTRSHVSICGMDKGMLELFPEFRIVEGNADALESVSMCLVSESFARTHSLTVGSELGFIGTRYDVLTVSGILADLDRTLFKNMDIVLCLKHSWFDYCTKDPFDHYGSVITFARVMPGTDRQDLYDKVDAICLDIYPNFYKKSGLIDGLEITRQDEMFLKENKSVYETGFNSGDVRTMKILSLVGLVLLISAILNYINLNLALTGKRAKEMATRQLLGSTGGGIIMKYIVESVAFTAVCFLMAVLLAIAITPAMNSLINNPDVPIRVYVTLPYLLVFIAFTIVVGTLSGLFPALVARRFKPIDTAKGAFRLSSRKTLSKVFIVIQNVFSVVLVALAITMKAQYRHSLDRPMNCNIKDCFYIRPMAPMDKNVLKQNLLALPCVKEVGYSFGAPGFNVGGQVSETRTGEEIIYRTYRMDTVSMGILEIPILKDYGLPATGNVWFSETSFKASGFDDDYHEIPVLSKRTKYCNELLGVFKDFPMRNTNTGQEGNAIISIIDTNDERFLMEMGLLIKTQGDHNEARKAIMKVFDEWDEDEVSIVQASTYLEDNFLDGLKPARNNMRMVELFMLLAVLISLLGLVAMSTYYSDIHSNEIAIRKVFGGTVGSESLRSIREYMILVGIACAIGIPIAVWAAGIYLEQFIWKLENYWWIFVVSVILSVLIALISVIWQTLRAARTNPAEALKKE